MGKLLALAEFFIERPALAGAVVWGVLWTLRKMRMPRHGEALSDTDRDRVLQLAMEQRSYAETMYELPVEERIREGRMPEAMAITGAAASAGEPQKLEAPRVESTTSELRVA
jgi:uncharacterized membrane protein